MTQNTKQTIRFLLILAALTWIVFGQTIHFDFFNFDDYDYLFDTFFVSEGLNLKSIGQAFTYTESGNWHPLVWLSLMADYQLFGKDPAGYHLVNVFFHLLNGSLLFLILKKWTKSAWASFVVTALFLVHPQRAESVAWITERKDVLSGLFFLLMLWGYTKYVECSRAVYRAGDGMIKGGKSAASRYGWYLLTLLFFALGLLSKSMLMTVPFLLLLLDYWPLQRVTFPLTPSFSQGDSQRRSPAQRVGYGLVIEKIPYLLLALASSFIAVKVRWEESLDINEKVHFFTRVMNSFAFYGAYIRDAFIPYPLTFYRPYPYEGIPVLLIMMSLLMIVLIVTFSMIRFRKSPYFFVGVFWFFGMLVPVIGWLHVGYAAYSDRYSYLPSIGLGLMTVFGLRELNATFFRINPKLMKVSAVTVILSLSFLGWHQTALWKDSEILLKHTLKYEPRNYYAHDALCGHLSHLKRYKEATAHCKEAIRIAPVRTPAYQTLAKIYLKQKKNKEAMEPLMRYVENVMRDRLAQDENREALIAEMLVSFKKRYQRMASNPNDPYGYYALGNFWAEQKLYKLAINAYRDSLLIAPKNHEIHINLANVYFLDGKIDLAKKFYEIGLKLDPRDPKSYFNYAVLWNSEGDFEKAEAYYKKTLQLDPNHEAAKRMLEKMITEKEMANK